LGLSITQRLVALHHGLITVDSQLGQGSVFHIYLPFPNLSNSLYIVPSNATQPVVLMVSLRENVLPEWGLYWQKRNLEICVVRSEQDVDEVLKKGLPAVIAWDTGDASEGQWQIIQRLRSSAELCGLPFLFYGHNDTASSDASVLLKPVKPKTLLNVLGAFFRETENATILIVDDDLEARHTYQEIVTNQINGYTCLTASDGKEALAIMEATIPRLVILDLLMPEMDGFAVIQWMRTNPRTRHVPVIVISGIILTFEDIKRLAPYQKIIYQSKDVLSENELASSLQQILFDNRPLPAQTSAVVKQALAYIHQNYALPLSRSTMAHQLGVSKNYLTQIFHQELGISLWDYLNRYRVMQAKELLRQTDSSIALISSQVGFDDPAYFSRVFRRYARQSPRIFRNSTD
jgi:AraC-like DNA-binding protein